MLQFLHGLCRRAVQATAVVDDTGDLDDTDAAQEEVNGSEARCRLAEEFFAHQSRICQAIQVVLGGNDHAPTGPDGSGGHQGTVLSEGELFSGTAEVGDTGDDESPLQSISVGSSAFRDTFISSSFNRIPNFLIVLRL